MDFEWSFEMNFRVSIRVEFPELGFESQSANLYQEVSDILIRGLKVVTFPKIISLIIVKLTCIKPLPGSRGRLFRSRPNEL